MRFRTHAEASTVRAGGRLSRREFLKDTVLATAALGAWGGAQPLQGAGALGDSIMTVLGPIRPWEMGVTLPHEHVLVDFIGAPKINPNRYSLNEAINQILPYLRSVKNLGCRTFVECTPAYLGRNPRLLRRLSELSGLHILTNTGYYGASDNKFLPLHAFIESADQLSSRWLAEWWRGIEGTDVRPGFIKIGVGGETLSPMHQKLVRAAAKTHLGSGLLIASHTGPAKLARDQLAILREEGVSPSAFVWVHAQNEPDLDAALRVATEGCWVSYDGFGAKDTEKYVEVVRRFRDEGRLGQLLLSHDAGWYRPGEPKGGEFRPYDAIFKQLLPALKKSGAGPEQIDELLVKNPATAFAIRVRALSAGPAETAA